MFVSTRRVVGKSDDDAESSCDEGGSAGALTTKTISFFVTQRLYISQYNIEVNYCLYYYYKTVCHLSLYYLPLNSHGNNYNQNTYRVSVSEGSARLNKT